MIELIRKNILTSDFIFILILLGFILIVTLLLLENRRDNIRLKQINQKVKDLIAGDYSQVLDMQGSSEITNITNNLNDLSEVIRLTQENLEQSPSPQFAKVGFSFHLTLDYLQKPSPYDEEEL